ncbi:putative helicase mov-10-B.1 [Anoplophora glabripennis]|uniref:putative helicase mov-10-B.1 n=1 Tax=Anoplophora glabripennis TaxID=217634 RepID=UPI000874F329|nr:putative helicase mov-10-B.1 [Anoplophora glabripennis]
MDGRHCIVCNLEHDEDDIYHNGTPAHRFNFTLFEWNRYKKALVNNRHGVEVDIQPVQVNGFTYNYTVDPKKGKHTIKITSENLRCHNNNLEFLCAVVNKRKNSNVILTSAILLHPYKLWSLTDLQNNLGDSFVELEPGAPPYKVLVKFATERPVVGSYKIPVSFNFQTVGGNVDTFTIARALIVSVEDIPPAEEEAAAKSPFTNNDWLEPIEIIPPTQNQRNICMYPIPLDMYPFLKMGLRDFGGLTQEMQNHLRHIRAQLDPSHVTVGNYRMFWHIVLWLEEVAQVLMLKRYNMENVTMAVNGELLELEVPGLAEKRPSVIAGDMIEVRVHEDHRAYRGVIKRVNDKTVDIGYVNNELVDYIKSNPKIELDVRFVMNRLPLERMHQGVDQTVMNGIVPYFFPDYSLSRRIVSSTKTIRETEFFNNTIVANKEQKMAVLNILNGTSMSAPYVVFGPPGTGKTVTIVEAILQIKKKTNKKILVCAPANAACDMLTEKLMMHCTRRELIRIMSENVDKQNMNELILGYTNYQNGEFLKPTAEEISEYRIVVTTLILIGRYSRKYHPDVVFIDEAAQPYEPEACCALGMIEKGKQIVLAGDPKQLGPSVASRVSGRYGLGVSLLERLMNLELYRTLNPNFITMLKQNFRSHRTILTLPNKLFYDDQLQAVSTRAHSDQLAAICVFEKIPGLCKKKKNKLPRPGQAVEFCSIISQECRQGRSPSYFNYKETQMVLKYVQTLTQLGFDSEEHKVLPEHIGVVTPYIRQVYNIREQLRKNNFAGIEVGTTETFQGREKRIIIISTVRAKDNLLAYDRKYNLGFVKNEKRFNVALTRAMSKLIVIGCPHVLGTDDKWEQYICHCEELDSFCGAPYARRTQDVKDEIVNRLGRIRLLDTQYKKQPQN